MHLADTLTILGSFAAGFFFLWKTTDKKFERVDDQFLELRKEINQRFQKVDEKFERIDDQFLELRKEIRIEFSNFQNHIDYRFSEINSRLLFLESQKINEETSSKNYRNGSTSLTQLIIPLGQKK